MPSAPTGTWRVRAYHRSEASGGRRGDLHGRGLRAGPARIRAQQRRRRACRARSRCRSRCDGRYLYGAPAAGLEVAGEVIVAPAAERAGFAGYRFGLSDEQIESTRSPLDGLPDDRRQRPGDRSRSASTRCPQATRPLEARVTVRLAEAGGRAVERKLTLPVTAAGPMIGVRPLFSGPFARRGRAGDLRCRRGRARRRGADAQRPALRIAAGRDPLSMVSPRQHLGLRAGQADPAHCRRPVQCHRRHAGAAVAAGAMGPLSAGDLDRRARRPGDLDRLRRRLVHRGDRRHARHARDRARQAGIRARATA